MKSLSAFKQFFIGLCALLVGVVAVFCFSACGENPPANDNEITETEFNQYKTAISNISSLKNNSSVGNVGTTSNTKSRFGFNYDGLYSDMSSLSTTELSSAFEQQLVFLDVYVGPIINIVNSANYDYSPINLYDDTSKTGWDVKAVVEVKKSNKTIYAYVKLQKDDYVQYNVIAIKLNNGGTDWETCIVLVNEILGSDEGHYFVELVNSSTQNLLLDSFTMITESNDSIKSFSSYEYASGKYLSDKSLLSTEQQNYIKTNYVSSNVISPWKNTVNSKLSQSGLTTINLDFYNDEYIAS